MKFRPLFAALFAMSTVSAAGEEEDFLSHFVTGNYDLIGKAPDSNRAYSGQVHIEKTDAGLKVTRDIGGETSEGTGSIEKALAGEVLVLRIRFSDDDTAYEETCLVGSDLDNYARITCYLYEPGGNTKSPGLEAFFIRRD